MSGPAELGPHRPRSGRWGSAAQLLLLAVPVVAMVVAGWQLRWMSDDGFIHLRVVSQLVHGNGPVFNAGERVEASTSPLRVALLALAYPVTSLVLPWKAIVLGIALTAAGLLAAERAAVTFAAARASRRSGPGTGTGTGVVLPLGALVVVALPPFWEFATSGLETGLAFAWLGTGTYVAARASAPPPPPAHRRRSRRDIAVAEEVLDCGQLGVYLRGIRRPLTPARFLANVVHAVPNTTFRVPPDPRTAGRRLCP